MSRRRSSGGLGSARVSRAGERVLAIANFPSNLLRLATTKLSGKSIAARRRNQHAGHVRYAETSRHAL